MDHTLHFLNATMEVIKGNGQCLELVVGVVGGSVKPQLMRAYYLNMPPLANP